LLFFTCIIINPIRSGEKFAFSEEVREKHIGFRNRSGKICAFEAKVRGICFQKVRINPAKTYHFHLSIAMTSSFRLLISLKLLVFIVRLAFLPYLLFILNVSDKSYIKI